MQVTRYSCLITLALLTSCAQPPATPANPRLQAASASNATSDQGEEAAKDIAVTYDRICLAAFPDETKLQDQLARFNAVELDQTAIRSFLHDDPGRGWRLPGTPFTVTIEAPPYRACGVRRMTRDGLPTAKPYLDALNGYSQRRALLKGTPKRVDRHLPSGADTVLLATPLSRAGAERPAEISIYAFTNYHGGLDPAHFPDAVGGVGLEVRLVHQLVPSP